MFLLKTDGQGNEEWRKTLEGWEGYKSSVQQTVDGGFVVTGTDGEGVLFKTDGQGFLACPGIPARWQANFRAVLMLL